VTRRYSLPYGGPRGGLPTGWSGEKGFVGGTIDAAVGLTHLGAREFDPDTGRFISVDPIIDVFDPQQMHGYAYANNSPVTYADADGLRACDNESCTKFVKPKPTKKVVKPKPKPKPKATAKKSKVSSSCDAKCRKESGCTGHNGCGPAGKPTTSKTKSPRQRLLDKDKQLDGRDKRAGVGKPKTGKFHRPAPQKLLGNDLPGVKDAAALKKRMYARHDSPTSLGNDPMEFYGRVEDACTPQLCSLETLKFARSHKETLMRTMSVPSTPTCSLVNGWGNLVGGVGLGLLSQQQNLGKVAGRAGWAGIAISTVGVGCQMTGNRFGM